MSDCWFQLPLKRALTKPTNKDIFNSVLKEFRQGFSEVVFMEINKRHFLAKNYDIVTLNIK